MRAALIGLAFCFLVGLGGCGSGANTVTVRGTVKLDGQPLGNAMVLFVASPESDARDATATTDAQGMFRLSTFTPGDGARPGTYKVVIQPLTAAADGGPETPDEAMRKASLAPPPKPAVSLPPRYTRPDQTPLTQEVPAKGPIVFELSSK